MKSYICAVALILFGLCPIVQAKVVTKEINYQAGSTKLVGYLAYDDEKTGKLPGILVVHEWWGNDDYPKSRARDLAGLGYAALAIDMYGDGKTTNDAQQAGAWSGDVRKNAAVELERMNAGLQALLQQTMVDHDRVAAIGYCFGGAIALDMARNNLPIKGVVSFHGDLSTPQPAKKVAGKILILTGGADTFVPPAQIDAFQKEMKDAGAAPKVVVYPNAHHAFTNPNADSHHIDNIKYDAEADKQSWQAMKEFLADLFGT